MSKLIVAATGKARNGKDSIADYLVKEYNFVKVSFAAPVKEFAVKHFGLTPDEVYGEKSKKSRWVLQAIGNGCREEFGDQIWIEKLWQKIGALERVVISDLRYLNEADFVGRVGGSIIKVTRPDAPEIECGADHPSEIEIERIVPDYALENDGDLEQLYRRVDGILSLIKDDRR